MKSRTIRAANRRAMKAKRGAAGSGRSRYARRMAAQRGGTFSVTSPFFSPALGHVGVRPNEQIATWGCQKPLLEQDAVAALWATVRPPKGLQQESPYPAQDAQCRGLV